MEKNKLSEKHSLRDRLKAFSDFLAGQKAGDVFVHIYEDGNPVADALIVASATSGRHARGLADGILRICPENGQEYFRMEGYEEAQWILVDCNDVIIHIFQPDIRDLYRLEDLCRQPAARKGIHQ